MPILRRHLAQPVGERVGACGYRGPELAGSVRLEENERLDAVGVAERDVGRPSVTG
jgi:hypothetical protein